MVVHIRDMDTPPTTAVQLRVAVLKLFACGTLNLNTYVMYAM